MPWILNIPLGQGNCLEQARGNGLLTNNLVRAYQANSNVRNELAEDWASISGGQYRQLQSMEQRLIFWYWNFYKGKYSALFTDNSQGNTEADLLTSFAHFLSQTQMAAI